jgi:predicted polyphosphate/ATP-dependent NAD kinase
MKTKVGIIVNPSSGKDIRRLVAFARVCDNMEKVNIVLRAIMGLVSVGIDEILIMPDTFGTGSRAIETLMETPEINIKNFFDSISLLNMPVTGTSSDSVKAAEIMNSENVGCIIVLGGDGTNRAVAKGCQQTPILPVSTGTNNVIPYTIESTIAGLAAGITAKNGVNVDQCTFRSKKLNVKTNNEFVDIALVDLVVTNDLFVGARAIWDTSRVKQVIATRGEPTNIGLSSISGFFQPIKIDDPYGVSWKIGKGGIKIKAPVAPGLIKEIEIEKFQKLKIGDEIDIDFKPSMLALDGEREIVIYKDDEVRVRLEQDGPLFVNIDKVMREAVDKGLFYSR